MSKEIARFTLSLKQCETELREFGDLLSARGDLTERNDLLPFFRGRPHLSAFIGAQHIPLDRIDCLTHELDVFGHFRADIVVGSFSERAYSLIEFEDATNTSVFARGVKYNDEWGARFEHGFSQIVDWLWTIEDQRHTNDFARRFGGSDARFYGMLIVGRRHHLPTGEPNRFPIGQNRLRWRAENVIIAGQKISCITFDDLFDALDSRLKFLRAIADAGDLQ